MESLGNQMKKWVILHDQVRMYQRLPYVLRCAPAVVREASHTFGTPMGVMVASYEW